METAQLWLAEWQRSHCSAALAELAGNQPWGAAGESYL